jgi:DNA invertase Pin-like site-specific DNA recombinase
VKRAALYLRVSSKEQTTENQRLELQRVADAKGWLVSEVYEDQGISGSKGRDKRPAYDRLLKDAVRSRFDVVMAWDVSRLGRSLTGLVQALEDLHANSVDLYLHQQALDTTTPSGRALFQMCGVFAEFERSMISERIKSGLQRVRQSGKALGRPRREVNLEELKALYSTLKSVRATSKAMGISVGLAHQLLKERSAST